eukprot:1902077-Pyramimonas_sp.AAC.1
MHPLYALYTSIRGAGDAGGRADQRRGARRTPLRRPEAAPRPGAGALRLHGGGGSGGGGRAALGRAAVRAGRAGVGGVFLAVAGGGGGRGARVFVRHLRRQLAAARHRAPPHPPPRPGQ